MSRAASTSRSFFYVASTPKGGKAMGIKAARSERALAEQLRKEKQVLVRTWALPGWANSEHEMSLRDHAEFDAQIAQLVSRGVPLTEALEVAAGVVSKPNRERIERLRHIVAQGTSFADACKQVGSFDTVTIATYRAAEKTGDLAGACRSLSLSARRQLEVSGKAATLMIYPAIVLTLALAAALVMIIVVVPMIGNSLQTAGVTLPGITRFLLNIGNFLRANLIPFGLAVVVLIVLAVLFRGALAAIAVRITRSAPFVRDVVMEQELTRFFAVMSSMSRSGIPLGDALHVSSAAITHPKLNRDLQRMRLRLIEGGVFRNLIMQVQTLPEATRRLLVAADQGGDLDDAFNALAEDHAAAVEKKTARLMAALEPLLIVLLFLIVGTIIISIMLPMFSMAGGAL
mgnify:CR=1 FL=1